MRGETIDAAGLRTFLSAAMSDPGFLRATFGGKPRGPSASPWLRVVVRPIALRGQTMLQFSYFDAKKHLARNFPPHETATAIEELCALGFPNVQLSTLREQIAVRISKRGKVFVARRAASADGGKDGSAERLAPEPHNRPKDQPLPEGKADRLLEVLGILTRTGQVRPTKRGKFTQINEFLRHLAYLVQEANLSQLGRPVRILDCGCGASFLTLAAHHYLNHVLALPAHVLGVDVNDDLIRKSRDRSLRLGAAGTLRFAHAAIGSIDERPDIVLALHACDTASDDALARAVHAQAKLVLCVPCCHHHLHDALGARGPAEVLRPVLRHGILRQRAADLATDAFRALALRIVGYRTDVVEFVSPEHTARNLLLRAVRGLPVGERTFVREYQALRRFLGVVPYIETALGESFQALVADAD